MSQNYIKKIYLQIQSIFRKVEFQIMVPKVRLDIPRAVDLRGKSKQILEEKAVPGSGKQEVPRKWKKYFPDSGS